MLHTSIPGVDSALTSAAAGASGAPATHMYLHTLHVSHEQIEGGMGTHMIRDLLGAEGKCLLREAKQNQRDGEGGKREREKREELL